MPLSITNSITRPSSSKIFDSGRLGFGDRSPIRTLSEDRVHVSLRLGSLPQTEEDNDELQLELATLSKAAGKKKVGPSQTRKRTVSSPVQGISVKRRRVTKVQPSPRRKLMLDAFVAGRKGGATTSRKTTSGARLVPPMEKKGKDFRLPSKALP